MVKCITIKNLSKAGIGSNLAGHLQFMKILNGATEYVDCYEVFLQRIWSERLKYRPVCSDDNPLTFQLISMQNVQEQVIII